MTLQQFLTRVIDDGIQAAQRDYTREDQAALLNGSIAGFEACRGQPITGLETLRVHAEEEAREAGPDDLVKYWWWRGYACEVEWVMNCVSAILVNQGIGPLLSWQPTANAMLTAARIVGVHVDA